MCSMKLPFPPCPGPPGPPSEVAPAGEGAACLHSSSGQWPPEQSAVARGSETWSVRLQHAAITAHKASQLPPCGQRQYHHAVPSCSATMPSHHAVPPCSATMQYHHAVPPCSTIMPVPPCSATMQYHHAVPPCSTTMQYHHAVPPSSAIMNPSQSRTPRSQGATHHSISACSPRSPHRSLKHCSHRHPLPPWVHHQWSDSLAVDEARALSH